MKRQGVRSGARTRVVGIGVVALTGASALLAGCGGDSPGGEVLALRSAEFVDAADADEPPFGPEVAGAVVTSTTPPSTTAPSTTAPSTTAPPSTAPTTVVPPAPPSTAAPAAPAAAPAPAAAAPAPTTPPPTAPAPTTPPPTAPPAPPPTAPPTTAPPPPPPPPPVADSGAAGTFVSQINGLRGGAGLPGLARSGDLDARAQAWAATMASSGSLRHSSNVGSLVAGPWSTAGENVGYGGSVSSVFSSLAASSGHRANMVNPAFTHVGVGVVVANGTVWTAHLFAG